MVEETPRPDGGGRVRFAPTMVMSTYLVAFVVGPLEATDPVDVDGVPLRVVHPPGKAHLTAFALEVGAHALRFFTDYFGIPYPGDKLDLVAIPDFAFGAMENLGCVTFRESALLVDPATAARVELERVADVVCHEIAHMWFGDLVTMKWWNGIWLNEAFATFMEVLAVDAFRPDWQRWVSFGVEREAAMAVDGLHATRPVEFPVGPPEEAQGMFDVLTYQKGGSVLRMLEQLPRARRLPRGHPRLPGRPRLRQHRDRRPVGRPRAVERPARCAPIMDTWINQGGYPLVPGGRRRHPRPDRPSPTPATPGGAIGSRLAGAGAPPPARRRRRPDAVPVLLDGRPRRPGRRRRRTTGLVNAGGSGYYRVAYPAATVERLAGPLGDLAPLERYNLVSDTWAAALAGQAPLLDLLRLAQALADRRGRPQRLVGGDRGRRPVRPDRPRRRPPGAAAGGPDPASARWPPPGLGPRPDDDERTPSLRSSVLRTLGTVGADPGVRAEAARRFAGRGDDSLAPRHRIGRARHRWPPPAATAEYEAFLARYRAPATPQEENRYLYALAGFDRAGPGRPDLRPGPDRGPHPERALRAAARCWPTG